MNSMLDRRSAAPYGHCVRRRFPECVACGGTALAVVLAFGASLWGDEIKPPWPPQYKLRPSERQRLTEADVVGPDGLVYPNWTKCGVQGGIPDRRSGREAAVEAFGAKADDGRDDSQALDAACRAMAGKGGGAVLLGPGVYHLDWPVTIRGDRVVIRGRGREATRIVFRYALPPGGVGFYTLKPGDRIGPETPVEVHCDPAGLQKISLFLDGVLVRPWQRSTHSGNTFSLALRGRDLLSKAAAGLRTLEAVAEYANRGPRRGTISLVLDPAYEDHRLQPRSQAAIEFLGQGLAGRPVTLAADGERGRRTLALTRPPETVPGELIFLEGPATPRWKELTRNRCPWGSYRQYVAEVAQVEGTRLTLTQPLRIEFPQVDGSYVQRFLPIRNCGIEDLTIEQTENLWITAALFSNAVNCWARNVKVVKCGRFPVYGSRAKWCEIRDCVFEDAWFKGGGGTAYAGWDHCWDCLMENVETFRLRHGPLFQWAASGNVIRQSVFHESDGQWHSGWTHENLIEQCVIESTLGNGGYGYGLWASPPEDTAHGPNGPRNVVYNCDVTSVRSGVWLGGMNEAWMFLHNRFVVAKGAGLVAKTVSFDHTIRGNVFVLKDQAAPMVNLLTRDCTGIDIVGNAVYGGSGQVVSGPASPAMLKDNTVRPLGEPSRPQPAVPSIYGWQKANLKGR